MERPERTYTEVLNKESVEKIREELMFYPIDVMDIEGIERQIKEKPEEEERILSESREKFLQIFEHNFLYRENNLFAFLHLVVNNNFFDNLLGDEDEIDLEDFYNKITHSIKNNQIDKEQWLSFLKWNRDLLVHHQEVLEEKYEILVKNFMHNFIYNINPLIRSHWTEEQILKVLNEYKVCVADILEGGPEGHQSFTKVITINLMNLISIDGREDEDNRLQHIFNHEALHALSDGQGVHRVKFSREIVEGDDASVWEIEGSSDWSGLQINQYNGEKFLWLNEAITETLAALSVGDEPKGYLAYIELLKLICTKGETQIDLKSFYDAYFEKKGYLRDKNAERNFWRELMNVIKKAFPMGDKNFLVYIDDIVTKKGIEKAIEILENWGSSGKTE